MDMRDAHLGIQVEDLDRACTLLNQLFGLTFAEPISGWPIHVRLGEGGEVEHSEASARPAFERWATTGVAEGAAAAFQRGRPDDAPDAVTGTEVAR